MALKSQDSGSLRLYAKSTFLVVAVLKADTLNTLDYRSNNEESIHSLFHFMKVNNGFFINMQQEHGIDS